MVAITSENTATGALSPLKNQLPKVNGNGPSSNSAKLGNSFSREEEVSRDSMNNDTPLEPHTMEADCQSAELETGIAKFPPDSTPSAQDARVQEAQGDLLVLVSRLSFLDNEGWFQRPVFEADAPNYHAVIGQPMCFDGMKEKVHNRKYVYWSELVRDFELICSNAMKYNQKRSRIHQRALVILRHGKKLLSENELVGRRALAVLNPGITDAIPSSQAGGLGARIGEAHTKDDLDVKGCVASVFEIVEPVYSSYDEVTDLEDIDDQPASLSGFLTAGEAVLKLPYIGSDPSDFENQAAPAHSSGLTDAWKKCRQNTEWRARWLEMRLLALEHQRDKYKLVLEELAKNDKVANKEMKHRERQSMAELAIPSLIEHPFFRDHAGIEINRTWSASQTTVIDDINFPARVHAALDMLSRQLQELQEKIGGCSQPPIGNSRPIAPARLTNLGRQFRRTNSILRKRPSSRDDIARLSKKRREQSSLNDIVTPGVFAPKYVERPQVKTIDTPTVRKVTEGEYRNAMDAVEKVKAALQNGDDAVEALRGLKDICPDDGLSSEEEESDEGFASRHAELEQKEREIYASVGGGGAQRGRRPGSTKVPKAKSCAATPTLLGEATLPKTGEVRMLGLQASHADGNSLELKAVRISHEVSVQTDTKKAVALVKPRGRGRPRKNP